VATDLDTGVGMVTVDTPLGAMTVFTSAEGVAATSFDADPALFADMTETLGAEPQWAIGLSVAASVEVVAYFEGRLRKFATPVDLRLVPPGFQRRVLRVTAAIDFGELRTYGDVAGAAGSPRGGRAAGNALNRCPIELFVPCHRVVHVDGSIGGYGTHEERKRWLLRHEGHS
jgi:methylated-DNA-[protein]-cysteine S-methyltransferase